MSPAENAVAIDHHKGVGRGDPRQWNLLRGDVPFPAAVLRESRIAHNLEWMRTFMQAYGMALAPHGKTTMAPALFRRQVEAGAWGVTVATTQQAEVAANAGVDRILIANQVVGAGNIAMLADLLKRPELRVMCLVDSPQGVAMLGAACRSRGLVLEVLLELAPEPDQPGFRTGVREEAGLQAVLAALDDWPDALRLAGVEFYEGVLPDEAQIRRFISRAVATTDRLIACGAITGDKAILSGAGSAWYDVVAEETADLARRGVAEVVLRPGCYISHDDGLYREAQARILARNPVAPTLGTALLPALQVWAVVQSIPDAGRAVVAMGKRDVAFDAGMPRPATQLRPGRDTTIQPAPSNWEVTGMMDQHAYLTFAPGDDIAVGDVIAFDISHPCLTFDKWRRLLIVDDALNCIEVVETFF
ncbi:alanine racemase [Novosphingobium guangzhouense]|uniref:Amino acid deaminase n=1 Tax=Novosphingobium guangzhouense TaxID=1850347 RepID=A0A2K2FTY9_9SPHN|nr:alanine racemase [Novosphingobium guangzhouense]PNU02242.1 amino acid deaminase [Novosphingobium guangzhouense]